ncbi:hypothetical protein AXG93_745s1090 [Marchantia polymorpha subsp. ruderalis]|uniref:Reverse transcriptase Ty1/copia-type domain-containing protein n=1 Tax=Marchantia polymorpha subsp. ruderalis TaxID=1480154 RepID=A0A176VRJ0_MARPO|nr:hypothetical protein AXG93_745s1090 [Marchantia polymorpha subsp. ruderalis]
MLSESGLPREFWAEAVNTAIYLAHSSILEDCDFDVEDEDAMAVILEEGEPSLYWKAKALVNKLEWNAAMEREMKSLIDNKTWELVEPSTDQTLIDSKWVYKEVIIGFIGGYG